MAITIVRALDIASHALLLSEHPDAIEARVVLLDLYRVLDRYERPQAVPLMKLTPNSKITHCMWCGKTIDTTSNPHRLFCCPSHRQRAYERRLRLNQKEDLTSNGQDEAAVAECVKPPAGVD